MAISPDDLRRLAAKLDEFGYLVSAPDAAVVGEAAEGLRRAAGAIEQLTRWLVSPAESPDRPEIVDPDRVLVRHPEFVEVIASWLADPAPKLPRLTLELREHPIGPFRTVAFVDLSLRHIAGTARIFGASYRLLERPGGHNSGEMAHALETMHRQLVDGLRDPAAQRERTADGR